MSETFSTFKDYVDAAACGWWASLVQLWTFHSFKEIRIMAPDIIPPIPGHGPSKPSFLVTCENRPMVLTKWWWKDREVGNACSHASRRLVEDRQMWLLWRQHAPDLGYTCIRIILLLLEGRVFMHSARWPNFAPKFEIKYEFCFESPQRNWACLLLLPTCLPIFALITLFTWLSSVNLNVTDTYQ